MVKKCVVLCDLDGTLIDSTQAIYKSFVGVFEQNNLQAPSLESVRALIGFRLHDMFSSLGVGQNKLDDFVNQYRIHYRELMEEGTYLLLGVKDAILQASKFAYLGIVTTKRGDFSHILMSRFGLSKYFSVIVGMESITHPKPHPEPILRALELIDKPNLPAYMIGDTWLDIEAALTANEILNKNNISAGIKAIGVLCGYGDRASLYKADLIYANMFEAIQYLSLN